MGVLEFIFSLIALVVICFTILMSITIISENKKEKYIKNEYKKNNIKMEDK